MKLRHYVLLGLLIVASLSADRDDDINFRGPNPFIYQPTQTSIAAYKTRELTAGQQTAYIERWDVIDKRYRTATMRDILVKSLTSMTFVKAINGITVTIATDLFSAVHAVEDGFKLARSWIMDRWYRELPDYAIRCTKDEWLSYCLRANGVKFNEGLSCDEWITSLSKEFRMQLLQDYYLHIFPGYLELMKSFPEYEDFMTDLRLKGAMGLSDYILEGYVPEEKIGALQQVFDREMNIVRQKRRAQEVEATLVSKVNACDRKNIIKENVENKEKHENLLAHKQELAAEIVSNVDTAESDYKVRLHDAIESYIQGNGTESKELTFTIDKEEAALLVKHGVPLEFFSHINGNQLQIAIHKEALQLLKLAKTIDDKEVRDLVVETTVVATEANNQGQLPIATRLIAFGNQLVDYARMGKDFSVGAVKGAWHSICNFASAIRHPIETVKSVKNGVIRLEQDIRPFLLLRARICWYEQLLNLAVISGKMEYVARLAPIIQRDEALFEQMRDEAIARRVDIFLQMSAEQKGELLGRAAMDTYLFGRITTLLSKVAQVTKIRLTATLQGAKKLQGSTVPLIAKEVPLELVYDPKTNSFSIVTETSATASAGVQTPAVGKVPAANPKNLVAVEGYEWMVPAQTAHNLIQARPYVEAVLQDIVSIEKQFNLTRTGFADFPTKYIKLTYKHVLAPDFNVQRSGNVKLTGFHHDVNGALEQSGIITLVNKREDTFGCYEAEPMFNGQMLPKKTFFPQSWSREKVISKIFEAYDNFKAGGATNYTITERGTYKFEAYTNEGIKIQFDITANGQINTCYPIEI